MSYLQPEQLTATAYADTALQLYLEQLQNHTADLVHVSPPNIDMSALATLQSTSAIANFQSDMASLDPCAAQDNSPACTYQDVSSQVEQAAQQQQETGRQASANGKQSAVWVQRNRKNQKTYRMKQKARPVAPKAMIMTIKMHCRQD